MGTARGVGHSATLAGTVNPERRTQILSSAARLFAEQGHADTTIADIARSAGIAVGSVYLEFCSKDAIVAELSGARHHGILAAMQGALAGPGTARERLVAMIVARTEAYLALARAGSHDCALVACASKPVVEQHDRHRAAEAELLARVLEDGVARRELAPVDAPATARILQRALATLEPPALLSDAPDAARAAAAGLGRLLAAGLPAP